MPVASSIRDVFAHFQNLNLLALVHDLRAGETARRGWSSPGLLLCPVAHGLPAGQQVRELSALGQAADLDRGCDYAARYLGAAREAVLRFVRLWDDEVIRSPWLLRQLEELWAERLTDADVVQELIQVVPDTEAMVEMISSQSAGKTDAITGEEQSHDSD
jgi:hypothetical protein